MSSMWILHDSKNKRNFCLGGTPRLWGDFLTGHVDGQPMSMDELEGRIPEGSRFSGPSPQFSVRLWAFCQVSQWHLELRWSGIDYDDEYSGSGWATRWTPHPLVGSLYSTTALDPDPCASEQARWEAEGSGK